MKCRSIFMLPIRLLALPLIFVAALAMAGPLRTPRPRGAATWAR
jgi:hypothetical protein